MNNHRKPKYVTPDENEARIRNLPKEKYRIPVSSKFSGREMTETIPVVTEKTMACLVKQLSHTEYLQRVDAAEKIGELAEKGVDVDKLLPFLEKASGDYSPMVRDAAGKALEKIKEKANQKKIKENLDSLRYYRAVFINGIAITLLEALRIPPTRKDAVGEISELAKNGIAEKNPFTRKGIAMQIREITADKMLFGNLDGSVKSDIRRILAHMIRDSEEEVRKMAKESLRDLKGKQ